VGKVVSKLALPAIAAGLASESPTIDEAIMNTIIPGGVESLGNKDEEAEMMGEAQGYKNYQKSPAAAARRAALQKLGK
jgi:hypothetical protein